MLKCLNVKMTNKGFTVIEVIMAIFIITAGIVGVLGLVTRTISSARISSQKLIAAYLAQEGIEIVRNIRDTNWLEQRTDATNSWKEGLIGCSAGCEADYTTPIVEDPTLPSYNGGRFLNIDADGYYSYFTTPPFTQTKFKRKITITQPAADILAVSVLVELQEKGKTYQVEAQENLYNWRGL